MTRAVEGKEPKLMTKLRTLYTALRWLWWSIIDHDPTDPCNSLREGKLS